MTGAPISRRQVLQLGAAGALAAPFGLAACASETVPAPNSRALQNLAKELRGKLLLPGDAGFAAASAPYNQAINLGPPQAVLVAARAEDIAAGIRYVREHQLPFTVRGGGHSYASYSTTPGLLINTTMMNQVVPDPVNRTVRVGPGANLGQIYTTLASQGFAIPGGSCPGVGISGLTLGGGYGLLGRKFGVLSDSLLGATNVLANGDIVSASDRGNSDLFWALRGGGGGNFGTVTSFNFQMYPVREVLALHVKWGWNRAREVFASWQSWAHTNPDDLTTICALWNGGQQLRDPTKLGASIIGQYLGSNEDELRDLLAPFVRAVGTKPVEYTITRYSFIGAVAHFAGCTPLASCPTSAMFDIQSAYVTRPYSERAIDTMVRGIEKFPGTSDQFVVDFDSYGGAATRPAPDATAFVHRDVRSCGQWQLYWGAADPAETVTTAKSWFNEFFAEMASANSKSAYVNYINPQQPDWQSAYYGTNYPRLQDVKRAYDPDNLFRFPQSIQPS